MRRHSTLSCDRHHDPLDCPDVLVLWYPTHGPGLPIRDGGTASMQIRFCPWCGTGLPHAPPIHCG